MQQVSRFCASWPQPFFTSFAFSVTNWLQPRSHICILSGMKVCSSHYSSLFLVHTNSSALNGCVNTHIQYFRDIQKVPLLWESSMALSGHFPSPLLLRPDINWSFPYLNSYAFSRMSHSWIHSVWPSQIGFFQLVICFEGSSMLFPLCFILYVLLLKIPHCSHVPRLFIYSPIGGHIVSIQILILTSKLL